MATPLPPPVVARLLSPEVNAGALLSHIVKMQVHGVRFEQPEQLITMFEVRHIVTALGARDGGHRPTAFALSHLLCAGRFVLDPDTFVTCLR